MCLDHLTSSLADYADEWDRMAEDARGALGIYAEDWNVDRMLLDLTQALQHQPAALATWQELLSFLADDSCHVVGMRIKTLFSEEPAGGYAGAADLPVHTVVDERYSILTTPAVSGQAGADLYGPPVITRGPGELLYVEAVSSDGTTGHNPHDPGTPAEPILSATRLPVRHLVVLETALDTFILTEKEYQAALARAEQHQLATPGQARS